MRILYITGSYLPHISGVTVSIHDFKKELEKLGHEVILLAPYSWGYQEKEPNVIRYPSLPNPFLKDMPIPLPFLTPRIVWSLLTQKIDLVHVHHPFYIGSFARFITKIKNIPLIFSYHSRYDAEYVGLLRSRFVKKP
jgi:glycosyltransferase involved in cell wall biosynthesis